MSNMKTPGKGLAFVIEDEYDLATLFARAIDGPNMEVLTLRAGDVALQVLKQAEVAPDVVVLDLSLPRVSGVEILKYLRGDDKFAHTKVIIATAYPEMAKSVRDSADMVLAKPLSYHELKDAAKELVVPK